MTNEKHFIKITKEESEIISYALTIAIIKYPNDEKLKKCKEDFLKKELKTK